MRNKYPLAICIKKTLCRNDVCPVKKTYSMIFAKYFRGFFIIKENNLISYVLNMFSYKKGGVNKKEWLKEELGAKSFTFIQLISKSYAFFSDWRNARVTASLSVRDKIEHPKSCYAFNNVLKCLL